MALKSTPKCPYCGAEMVGELEECFDNVWGYQYRCHHCGSVSPLVLVTNGLDAAKAEALEKALHRAEDKNRVLTLEEATGSGDYVWIEMNNSLLVGYAYIEFGNNSATIETIEYTLMHLPLDDYGKTWRCWLKEPTEEKRATTPWEER